MKYKTEQVLLVLLLQIIFIQLVGAANLVNGIRVWDAPGKTRVIFDLKNKAAFETFRLSRPERLVVDLKQSRLKTKIPSIKRNHALIKKIRSASRKNTSHRFVIDIKDKLKYRVYRLSPNKKFGHRLVIELTGKNKTYSVMQASAVIKKSYKKTHQPLLKRALRDVVVAIDAGHGGEDPGALGYYGSKEKNITLIIARKLKKIIDKQPGMRAILTRKDDYYVSLRKRIKLARNAKADMFVSIHADAFKNPRVEGSSVYVLSERGASDEASKWLADQENSVDLVGGVSLGDKDKVLAKVLLDLSQTATIEASTRVAVNVLSEIRKITPVHKKTVQHARFVVLKSPDIPSLLVETAFISNPKEEKLLRDHHYQNKLAKAILAGVKVYFEISPPPNTYFAKKNQRLAKQTGDTFSRFAIR